MTLSKSQIDKSGRSLAFPKDELTEEDLELEALFDAYRASHLQPLSETTMELQQWLYNYGSSYYIAQRLKRKPQIIRKLKRLSVRLSQLQDIGGCRIIVEDNKGVDDLEKFVSQQISKKANFKIYKKTDYRDKGRDDTGYRSLHLILERSGKILELQIRSKIQHYWAETIERTSVIYGYHLKEKEGNPIVISYFKKLSDVFFEIENGKKLGAQLKLDLEILKKQAEDVILKSDKNKIFGSYVNEDVLKTLSSVEGNKKSLNSWLIVFNWNTGRFETWDIVSGDPEEAVKKYVAYEKQFTAENNYEVVLIGSSDIASVRQTHSHYFGIDSHTNVLEDLDESILGFSTKMDIDVDGRRILALLVRKKYWGKKSIKVETLKNHFLKEIIAFDSSLRKLKEKGLILWDAQSPVSLNLKKKQEIESYTS
jgi:ppGpp synthetase/RelA/SpoT-type nucleotidyltranferase